MEADALYVSLSLVECESDDECVVDCDELRDALLLSLVDSETETLIDELTVGVGGGVLVADALLDGLELSLVLAEADVLCDALTLPD